MKKRRILLGVIAATGLFALASCGGESEKTNSQTTETSKAATSKAAASSTAKSSSVASSSQVVREDEIEFTGTTAEEVKLEAATASNNLASNASLSANAKITIDIVLAYVNQEMSASTETDVEKLKEDLNDLYKYLYDAIQVVKQNASNKTYADREADILRTSIESLINELNVDYIEYVYAAYSADSNYASALTTFRTYAKYYFDNALDSTVETVLSTAKSGLKTLYDTIYEKCPDDATKNAVRALYETTNANISAIVLAKDKDRIEEILDEFKYDVYEISTELITLEIDKLKEIARAKLDELVTKALTYVTNTELRTKINTFYNTEADKIQAVSTQEEADALPATVKADTEAFILTIVDDLKEEARTYIDGIVLPAIDKISDTEIKTDLTNFYNTEADKIEAIDSLDGIETTIAEIKKDTEDFVKEELNKELIRLKNAALAELSEVVEAGLDKMPNEEVKADLTEFWNTEKAKINAVTEIDNVAPTLTTVLTETEQHIKDLLISTVKDYLARLTAVETATAYDYIPAAMQPNYEANLVTAADIAYDFTTDTQISAINQAGYGEQWQMVIENINQSVTMAKVFNVGQTAFSAAGNAVDIYITNSYADSMEYTYTGNNFTVDFTFTGTILTFNLKFTSSINVPLIGAVSPIINMSYDIANETKTMYVKVSDNYVTKYTISDSLYELATHYGVTLLGQTGSRSSYLSISKDSNKNTVGHIYEYTTLNGSDKIQACADFLVSNGYVTVVGNKASGMVAFDGYISELYSATEGRLLGYEVQEELTFAGVTGTYNTLWFNMRDMNGISSIKVTDKTDANESGKSTVDTYLNGSTSLLVPAYNKKAILTTSRKYDVELRNRYYYSYDSTNDAYVVTEVQVPMFFIQEGDNYTSFESDFKDKNGFEVSVGMSSTVLNRILNDYDTYIPVFKENKDLMSSDIIDAYLGIESTTTDGE
ncbi:MAG: hypothetical protein K6A63_06755 [Acholeplasmatales bacterium]|nr:hypothetical protein [Acholeplasmatales bacterium]